MALSGKIAHYDPSPHPLFPRSLSRAVAPTAVTLTFERTIIVRDLVQDEGMLGLMGRQALSDIPFIASA